MRKLISFKLATQLSLILFGLFILFHLSIVIGIVAFDWIPVDYLWGGRMKTREQLLFFEIISTAAMILCFLVVLIRSDIPKWPGLMGVSKALLWLMVFLFLLNTLGNILAKSAFEKLFAIFTVSLTMLCFRLALEKK
jgi:hypothetical protein